MYDELVKRLREHNGWALNETLDQAADAIEELSKPRWIPVTERLPDESEPVLAYVCWPDYTDNEICYGQYIKNGRFRLTHYVEGELIKGYEVKAWMPLPSAPKEEAT